VRPCLRVPCLTLFTVVILKIGGNCHEPGSPGSRSSAKSQESHTASLDRSGGGQTQDPVQVSSDGRFFKSLCPRVRHVWGIRTLLSTSIGSEQLG
jgi:hypothetical protein